MGFKAYCDNCKKEDDCRYEKMYSRTWYEPWGWFHKHIDGGILLFCSKECVENFRSKKES
jgi:hypothetical protein